MLVPLFSDFTQWVLANHDLRLTGYQNKQRQQLGVHSGQRLLSTSFCKTHKIFSQECLRWSFFSLFFIFSFPKKQKGKKERKTGMLVIDCWGTGGLFKGSPDFLQVLQIKIDYKKTININRPQQFLLFCVLLYELKVTQENIYKAGWHVQFSRITYHAQQ